MDRYTQIAQAAKANREDVKRILHAAAMLGMVDHSIEVEGGNGGSYIKLAVAGTGMVDLEVGETCVHTIKQRISVRALAVILTQAKDIGFEKLIDDYCRSPGGGGVANVPLDQDMPRGKRNKDGSWPSQGDV